MLEDALKTTRSTYRLLLVATVASVVFLASLNNPTRLQRKVQALEHLASLASRDYGLEVEGRIDQETDNALTRQEGALLVELEERLESFQILGIPNIAAVFGKPVHVARMRPEEIGFGELSLVGLDRAMGELPLDQDVVAYLPTTEGVAQVVGDWIEQNIPERLVVHGEIGLLENAVVTITNLSLTLDQDPSWLLHSFLEPEPEVVTARLDFELAATEGVSPIFGQSLFPVQRVELSKSSWLGYLSNQAGEGSGPLFDGEKWLATTLPLAEERTKTVPTLLENLRDQRLAALAANREIEILGFKIPGRLAVAAIPLGLLALLGSLGGNLRHLRRRFEGDSRLIEFAWSPLNDRLGLWEFLATAAVLPSLTLLFLLIRAPAFELSPWAVAPFLLLTSAALLRLAREAAQELHALRSAGAPSQPVAAQSTAVVQETSPEAANKHLDNPTAPLEDTQ